jgi:hypothetical protein
VTDFGLSAAGVREADARYERAFAAAILARRGKLQHLERPVPFVGAGQASINLVEVGLTVLITSGPFSVALSDSRGRVVVRRDGFAQQADGLDPGQPYPPGTRYRICDQVWIACGVSLNSTWTLSGCTFVEDARTLVALLA